MESVLDQTKLEITIMFEFIRGRLIQVSSAAAVIDVNGIGYKIFLPACHFTRFPELGGFVTLYTSFVVREFSHALYGFLSVMERDVFEILLNVSGIGPKIALSIVGHMPLANLQEAMTEGDVSLLCKVPGIGKKTAERMIIELRDKLTPILPRDVTDSNLQEPPSHPKNQMIKDAMSALINLGYNQMTAQKAIKKTLQGASEDIDLTMLITTSLKHV